MIVQIVLEAITVVLTAVLVLIAWDIRKSLKAAENHSESAQAWDYQQAVSTPKDNRPKAAAKKPQDDNLVDLADLDFATGYEAVAAYGRGEN